MHASHGLRADLQQPDGVVIFIPVMVAALGLRKHHPERYVSSSIQLKGFLYFFAPSMGLLRSNSTSRGLSLGVAVRTASLDIPQV